MTSFRMLTISAATATFCLTGYAKTPVDAHHPDTAPNGNMTMMMGDPDVQTARMDEQMKAMQAMHEKMMKAKTPEERSTLMAEHMKVMQDSMAMMDEMGSGGMMGKRGMGGMKNKSAMREDKSGMHDVGVHRHMMEKRMEMMQSMMQMMMDRMPADPRKS